MKHRFRTGVYPDKVGVSQRVLDSGIAPSSLHGNITLIYLSARCDDIIIDYDNQDSLVNIKSDTADGAIFLGSMQIVDLGTDSMLCLDILGLNVRLISLSFWAKGFDYVIVTPFTEDGGSPVPGEVGGLKSLLISNSHPVVMFVHCDKYSLS